MKDAVPPRDRFVFQEYFPADMVEVQRIITCEVTNTKHEAVLRKERHALLSGDVDSSNQVYDACCIQSFSKVTDGTYSHRFLTRGIFIRAISDLGVLVFAQSMMCYKYHVRVYRPHRLFFSVVACRELCTVFNEAVRGTAYLFFFFFLPGLSVPTRLPSCFGSSHFAA